MHFEALAIKLITTSTRAFKDSSDLFDDTAETQSKETWRLCRLILELQI